VREAALTPSADSDHQLGPTGHPPDTDRAPMNRIDKVAAQRLLQETFRKDTFDSCL
jgi:hypothetical protein